MTFLEFLQNKKDITSVVTEGFSDANVAKAHELILSIFKKKISGGKIVMDKSSMQTKVGDETCNSFLFMHIDGPSIKHAWILNYLNSGNTNDIYSIDFFDGHSMEDMMFGKGKAKSKLSIYTLGSSIAYFIPIICHVVNNDDYELSNSNAKKIAAQVFANSAKNEALESEYYYGACKYNIYENLEDETINEAFHYNTGYVFEASEAQNYRWKLKKERDDAYKTRKEDPEKFEKLKAEYDEVVNAIHGGATTLNDLQLAIKHGLSVEVSLEPEVKEAEDKLEKDKEDPKVAFKKMGVYIKSVINGIQPGCILCGAPGVGKTYRVKQYLKAAGYKEGYNLYTIKGTESPRQLYIDMYNFKEKGKIIVIDDADALVGPKAPEIAINILKAALDSTADDEGRLVSYKVTGDLKDEEGLEIPKRMYFNAGVIVISNYNVGQLNTALKGRVFTQTLSFTPEQILEIIKDLIPKMEPTKLSMDSKMKAYDFLMQMAQNKEKMELSIRSFITCSRLFELTKDEDFSEKEVQEMIAEQMRNQAARGGKSF